MTLRSHLGIPPDKTEFNAAERVKLATIVSLLLPEGCREYFIKAFKETPDPTTSGFKLYLEIDLITHTSMLIYTAFAWLRTPSPPYEPWSKVFYEVQTPTEELLASIKNAWWNTQEVSRKISL